MLQVRVRPNESAFSILLVACSHAILIHDSRLYFKTMLEEHNIVPTLQHYTCMVDLLWRSGHVHGAETLLLNVPFKADDVGWTALLSACKTECGKRCFHNLVKLNPQDAAPYVLMATSMQLQTGGLMLKLKII